jgi:hypothetical protein
MCNALLIIIIILVVLFYMTDREGFIMKCDDCATALQKSNCVNLPKSMKVNGGCPPDLSVKLAINPTWIKQCAMWNKPCFDSDEKDPKKIELRKMFEQVEKLRGAYNTLDRKRVNMPEGPAKNKITETMNKLGKRADDIYAKAEDLAKTM